MITIHAKAALLPSGQARNVRVTIEGAAIARVELGVAESRGDVHCDYLVPALSNLHSHAFQRAMAGFAESRSAGPDNFWNWRETMYRFALSMTPDDVEAIATQLYVEMLEAGFTRVGEFHYLHHDIDGTPYNDTAEMVTRIASATTEAGISLTMLPVYYAHSGFGGTPPRTEQRRFLHDIHQFSALMSRTKDIVAALPGGVLGVAPHSLRAVGTQDLAVLSTLADGGPIHIHIAEQVAEVEQCLAWSGSRPVNWLIDNAEIDRRWCLIHATHVDAAEMQRLAEHGAVVGLCPITEANLGDGIFPAGDLLALGGSFGIGSDSNILISARHELQQLEYSQRLDTFSRSVIASPSMSTGQRLWNETLSGGAQALGVRAGIEVGLPADLVSLSLSGAPWLRDDLVLDCFIFSVGVAIDKVWARGRLQVEHGRHLAGAPIYARFAGRWSASCHDELLR